MSSNTDRGSNFAPPFSLAPWQAWWDYSVDFCQRGVLFWDTLRRRGNDHLEQAAKPLSHVLSYAFEVVMDGRELPRPVNYGLVRIVPPAGVEVDASRRPFVVVDPRAGHGPGIGGFKPDSEIGAVLRAGHPCYFIGFLTRPVVGQTIEDVGRAEFAFLQRVAERHPDAEGKPCVIANCQAGWAMAMLAAVATDAVGPLLVAGSPLSYWAGVRGENPMRYAGGLLGGTWVTALAGDLGNGLFDGAHLVTNFENLNPANTLWSKHYNLWAKIDSEAPRYLEFERWWGAHTLLGAQEMLFIADELFVGNKLVRGEIQTSDGLAIDLRNIRSPIVVFCSQGDNITPPPQALRWILDLYQDVDEIHAFGQTIVYVLHPSIGHLGIFVSSKVGRKEHDQLAHNMDLIDVLPPGLYEATLRKKTETDAGADLAHGDYIVTFERRTLDDIRALGDAGGADDRAFEAVARVSAIGQGLYNTFVAPAVRATITDAGAEVLRQLHPGRLQYTLFSDNNPWLRWTATAAEQVKQHRQPVAADNPFLALEHQVSDTIVTTLNAWRDWRDWSQEQLFFALYGSPLLQAMVGLKASQPHERPLGARRDPARMALVNQMLDDLKQRMAMGGPREAAARALVYILLPEGRVDERGFNTLRPLLDQLEEPLSLGMFKQLVREQYTMVLLDEGEALAALPKLLPTDLQARRRIFDGLMTVTTAAGTPSPLRKARLDALAVAFGLEDSPEGSGEEGPSQGAAAVSTPSTSTSQSTP